MADEEIRGRVSTAAAPIGEASMKTYTITQVSAVTPSLQTEVIITSIYNFEKIQSLVDAARALQAAGQHIRCKEVLRDLAEDILKSSP
jgi:hypothetical protein